MVDISLTHISAVYRISSSPCICLRRRGPICTHPCGIYRISLRICGEFSCVFLFLWLFNVCNLLSHSILAYLIGPRVCNLLFHSIQAYLIGPHVCNLLFHSIQAYLIGPHVCNLLFHSIQAYLIGTRAIVHVSCLFLTLSMCCQCCHKSNIEKKNVKLWKM